jgi:hypothetical protein
MKGIDVSILIKNEITIKFRAIYFLDDLHLRTIAHSESIKKAGI